MLFKRNKKDPETLPAPADITENFNPETTFGLGRLAADQVIDTPNTEVESLFEIQAKKVIDALVLKYEAYGVKPEDFEIVEVPVYGEDENRESKVQRVDNVVVYGAADGIDLGDPHEASQDLRFDVQVDEKRTYRSIMANPQDERFIIEIDGERFDSRLGMTGRAYEALRQAKHTKGKNCPDQPRQDAHGVLICYRATLMTGEESRFGEIGVRPFSSFGGIMRIDDGYAFLRFRPAVILPTEDDRVKVPKNEGSNSIPTINF